jgi:hypothetical protein
MNEKQLKYNISIKVMELLSSSSKSNLKLDYTNLFNSNNDFHYVKSSSINRELQSSSSTSQQFNNDLDILASRTALSIKNFLINDEYVEGDVSKTQLYLESLYYKNSDIFRNAFQKAWLDLYALEDPSYLYTFICISAAIDYEWLGDKADVLIISGCCHDNPQVNEAAIRAAESWEQSQHMSFLSNIRPFNINWLDIYKEQVIAHLKSLL